MLILGKKCWIKQHFLISTGINGDNTILGKKDDNKTKVMIFIAVPVGATLIFAACAIIIFIRRRMKQSSAYEIAKSEISSSSVISILIMVHE